MLLSISVFYVEKYCILFIFVFEFFGENSRMIIGIFQAYVILVRVF